jgi:hypothetical protein
MDRPVDATHDPAIVIIPDELSALSDEEAALRTRRLLKRLAARPVLDLGDLDIAQLIREDRPDHPR